MFLIFSLLFFIGFVVSLNVQTFKPSYDYWHPYQVTTLTGLGACLIRNQTLVYRFWNTGQQTWSDTVVYNDIVPESNEPVAALVDSDGTVSCLFTDNAQLFLASTTASSRLVNSFNVAQVTDKSTRLITGNSLGFTVNQGDRLFVCGRESTGQLFFATALSASGAVGPGSWDARIDVDPTTTLAWYCSITMVSSGRLPAISYQNRTSTPFSLAYAVARTGDGSGPWTLVAVDSSGPTGDTGYTTSLAVVNDLPVIAYSAGVKTMLALSATDEGTSVSDWTVLEIEYGAPANVPFVIALPNVVAGGEEQILVAYNPLNRPSVMVRVASDPRLSTGSFQDLSWLESIVVNGSDFVGKSTQGITVVLVEGRPAISFATTVPPRRLYWFVNSQADAMGSWRPVTDVFTAQSSTTTTTSTASATFSDDTDSADSPPTSFPTSPPTTLSSSSADLLSPSSPQTPTESLPDWLIPVVVCFVVVLMVGLLVLVVSSLRLQRARALHRNHQAPLQSALSYHPSSPRSHAGRSRSSSVGRRRSSRRQSVSRVNTDEYTNISHALPSPPTGYYSTTAAAQPQQSSYNQLMLRKSAELPDGYAHFESPDAGYVQFETPDAE